jgi:hypothetical protein
MQIVYGGVVVASDPPGGAVGVLGFSAPKAEQSLQWIEGLRALDAFPISRVNRKRTVSGTIYPAPLATLAAAKLAREQFYELLPASGALVLTQDTEITTFAVAVLQGIDVVEGVTEGVSFGLQLTFAVGPPAFTVNPASLQDSAGADVTDSKSNPIQTN